MPLTRESHVRRGDYRKRFLTPLGLCVVAVLGIFVLLAIDITVREWWR